MTTVPGASEATIRLARGEDMAVVCDIVNHYIRTSTVNFRTAEQHPDEWSEQWAARCDRYPWLVAGRGDRVIGVAYAEPWKARNAYDWIVETTIYVDPDARGAGVGRRLYDRLLAILTRQGYRSAIAVIGLPNEGSVALHERCGYQPVGRIAHAGFKMNTWLDVGFWQRPLNPVPDVPREVAPVAEVIGAYEGGDNG